MKTRTHLKAGTDATTTTSTTRHDIAMNAVRNMKG